MRLRDASGVLPGRNALWTRLGPWLLALGCLAVSGCSGGMSAAERERNVVARESSAAALLAKGEASASVGDLTRAEQYLVAALKAGGDEQLIVRRLLVVCVADERYPVALEYAHQYLYRHPEDEGIRFAAAAIHAATGELERARALLERVVKEQPRWAEAHYALATVLRDGGDSPEQADQHDLAYLKLAPKGEQAETARARLRRNGP
jgi:tetratricopeptide (TPR) repeat protein